MQHHCHREFNDVALSNIYIQYREKAISLRRPPSSCLHFPAIHFQFPCLLCIYLLLLFEKTTILEQFFIAILGGRLKEVLLHKTNTILLSNRYNRSTITAPRPHVDFKQLDSQHLSLHGCHSAQKSLLTHTLFPIYFSINIILFIYLSIYPYVIYLSTYTHWQTKYCTKKELCECNDNICKWL